MIPVRFLTYGLAPLLLLSACTHPVQAQEEQRNEALAYRYMARCVQSIERRRVQPGTPQLQLPRSLDGQSCEGPVLGSYTISTTRSALVKGSVIRLDPSRLSDFTLEVESLDGHTLTYKDRGKVAAAAEQARTFGPDNSGQVLPADLDGTERDPNAAGIQIKP